MRDVVRGALIAHKSSLELCFIPGATRELMGKGYAMRDVHASIVELSEAGEIDMLADGGGEYLEEEDEAICPPGPRGTVFSRCRFL